MITLEQIFKIEPHPMTKRYRKIEFRWNNIEKIPEFEKLKKCEQNPKWHSEGDAFKHTKLVCKYAVEHVCTMARYKDPEHGMYNISKSFDEYETCYLEPSVYDDALVFLTAALFHDVGKGVTTAKGKDGNWHSYNHEFEGEKITRQMLWNLNTKFREDVCALVKYHMIPLNLFDRKNYLEEIVRLSYDIPSWELLIELKKCDLEGSIQKDEVLKERDRKILNEVASIAMEIDRYQARSTYKTSVFADRIRGSQYFLDKTYKKPLELIVLIGLPGAGKDTFINEQLLTDNKDMPTYINVINMSRINKPCPSILTVYKSNAAVICRDDTRVKLGFCKENEKIVGTSKQENAVNEDIKNQLYEAAREGKTIIINNTNLKKEYRAEFARLLSNYNVHITYIYIEATDVAKNVERREGQISKNVLLDIIKKFEWPTFDEYDDFFMIRN